MAITARELAEKLLHDTAPVEDNKYLLVNEIEQEILAAEQRGRKSVLEHFDEDNIRRTWMNYLDDIIEKEGGYEYDHFHSIIETHRAHLAKIKEPSTEKESPEQVDMSQKDEKNDTSKERVDSNDISEQAFEEAYNEFRRKHINASFMPKDMAKFMWLAGRASRELKLPSEEEMIDKFTEISGIELPLSVPEFAEWLIKALNEVKNE